MEYSLWAVVGSGCVVQAREVLGGRAQAAV